MYKGKKDPFGHMQRKSKVDDVLKAFSRQCESCKVYGSKRPIYNISGAILCLKCLPEGTNPLLLAELEAEEKARMEAESKKPKPKSYGQWA